MCLIKNHKSGKYGGCQWLEGGENEVLVMNRYRVLVSQNERFLEMVGGEVCTRMWNYLMPLNCGQNDEFHFLKYLFIYLLGYAGS